MASSHLTGVLFELDDVEVTVRDGDQASTHAGAVTAVENRSGRFGRDVVTSDVECCGMAGSFGYKSQYYDLAMAVGESLADDLAATGVDDRPVVTSGTSCQEQLGDLLADQPRHPVELLTPGEE